MIDEDKLRELGLRAEPFHVNQTMEDADVFHYLCPYCGERTRDPHSTIDCITYMRWEIQKLSKVNTCLLEETVELKSKASSYKWMFAFLFFAILMALYLDFYWRL